MEILIEQQAVIDCLTNTAKYYEREDADEWTKGIHYGLLHGVDNILDNVKPIEAIPKADYENRLKAEWNPFDSTIPLEDGDYLVTYEDPQTHKLEVLIARYHMAVHEEDECKFYDDSEVEITLAVKAWQPLPEPYMEDD